MRGVALSGSFAPAGAASGLPAVSGAASCAGGAALAEEIEETFLSAGLIGFAFLVLLTLYIVNGKLNRSDVL